ncbi:MAG: sugar-binding domain-containing protein [Phycisphaerae bacterium]
MKKKDRILHPPAGRSSVYERSGIEHAIRGIPLAELLTMARRHLVDRESAEEVCGDRFKPQQFRQALFEARRRGLLRQFVILTPELSNVASLDVLAREVEESSRRFRSGPPVRVHLVFGDRAVFEETQAREARDLLDMQDGRDLFLRNEALVERMIDAAIDWISRELCDDEVFVPAWGRVVRRVVGGLRPWAVKSLLDRVTVVAGSGLLGVQAFADFEAGNNARLAGEIFGTSNVHLMPLPFCVPGEQAVMDQLRLLKPVRDNEQRLREATMVITSLQDFNPRQYSVVRHGIMDVEAAAAYKKAGACGEITGVPFDENGDEVVVEGHHFTGIHPADLKRTVGRSEADNPKVDKHDRRRREVIVVAGATASRIRPLSIAIRSGLVTRVFSDHVTAQALIDEFERN